MRVLAVGAHPDDIELGCAAALLAHEARGDHITLLVMTTGEEGPQDARSREVEQEEAAGLLGADLLWGGFSDGAIPVGKPAITVVEAAIKDTGAGVIYTHASADTHQDHRHTAAATLSAARRCRRVLQYEAPTSIDFNPTLFIDVAEFLPGKLDVLRAHTSQVLKNGLVDLQAVEAQARFYGFKARLRYAEGFISGRFVWSIGQDGVSDLPMSITDSMASLRVREIAAPAESMSLD
jgi:LmbE family N-acetylglucosaminyl deacetylase